MTKTRIAVLCLLFALFLVSIPMSMPTVYIDTASPIGNQELANIIVDIQDSHVYDAHPGIVLCLFRAMNYSPDAAPSTRTTYTYEYQEIDGNLYVYVH